MEISIEEIVHKLHSLPEAKIQSVLDFVDFLTLHKERSRVKEAESKDEISAREDEELEAIADNLADQFEACVGTNVPVLSDYAVSRAGIYEEHP
ncbi:hypothetical protein H6S82_12650 [Planktothrix sp. FACHB-1355]|uniref:DUF2281 domain-containing protein n=1 Tax=Aerosakkonema funiforme FACHB-1375 TaxID=2949571 RepID=A0A926VAD8_9CYAN|nr:MULTISPECIES: hypothetical protein [Oscillatoriales]MBD2180040.1 hypothetical protein [Aerosakkonema funiforme FACHB-1375]MBD3559707.1 hypothetical protein [Planktothrix sp. FACHB-1355]